MPLQALLPPCRIHLLSGYRDSGKTSFILPAMIDWRANGGPPWAYVAADRSKLDAHETIQRMGFKLLQVPIVYSYGRDHKGWRQLIEAFVAMQPRPEVVVIEAFQYLCDSLNRHKIVDVFMNEVDAFVNPSKEFSKGLIIIGICGGAKRSMRDKYPDPTQRVPGCATWVERASSILMLEPDPKDPEMLTNNRVLYACGKQIPRRRETGVYDANNRLIFPNL